MYGIKEYGREDETTAKVREQWSFEPSEKGAEARASCADSFWPALHMDLRMVDTSDFLVAYVPTNVYSVGTRHEMILCRQQRRPVSCLSVRQFNFRARPIARSFGQQGRQGWLCLTQAARKPSPSKRENPTGSPSLWYMPLIGGEHFFDGFGFAEYQDRFQVGACRYGQSGAGREPTPQTAPAVPGRAQPKAPLQMGPPFAEVRASNDDWLLWKLEGGTDEGAHLAQAYDAYSQSKTR